MKSSEHTTSCHAKFSSCKPIVVDFVSWTINKFKKVHIYVEYYILRGVVCSQQFQQLLIQNFTNKNEFSSGLSSGVPATQRQHVTGWTEYWIKQVKHTWKLTSIVDMITLERLTKQLSFSSEENICRININDNVHLICTQNDWTTQSR